MLELEQDPPAAQQQKAGRRICKRLVDGIVAAVLRLAVDRVAGEADELARLGLRRIEKAKGHSGLGKEAEEGRGL